MRIWCGREYTLYQRRRRHGFIGAISCPYCVQLVPPVNIVHDHTVAHILLQCPQHDSQRQQLIDVYTSNTQLKITQLTLDNIILTDETIKLLHANDNIKLWSDAVCHYLQQIKTNNAI